MPTCGNLKSSAVNWASSMVEIQIGTSKLFPSCCMFHAGMSRLVFGMLHVLLLSGRP
jgi:hypothetical protein